MSKLNLKLNKRIQVLWEKEEYKSIIQDFDDDCIKISIPIRNGSYLTMVENQEIEISYLEDSYNCFAFKCKVITRMIEANIALYVLSLPYNVNKIQRRNFVRVQAVEYTFYKHKDNEEDWKKGLIIDLSGGGLRLKVKEPTKLDEHMLINLYNEDEKIEVKGIVVRVEKNEYNESICGLNFIDLDERTREKIIRKVFTIMRQQRELV